MNYAYIYNTFGPARITKGIGEGHISKSFAEKIGKVYESTPFSTAGYRGEQRFHRALARANLPVDCKITRVQIPVLEDVDGDKVPMIQEWPVLLPYDLASALIDRGFLHHLSGDSDERRHFWQESLKDYPEMVGIDVVHSSPITLYGDECNAFRQQVMTMHWTPTLHPCKKTVCQADT